jgi:hypothetical protein
MLHEYKLRSKSQTEASPLISVYRVYSLPSDNTRILTSICEVKNKEHGLQSTNRVRCFKCRLIVLQCTVMETDTGVYSGR